MRHHAILVTSWSEDHVTRAHAEAERLGVVITPVVKSPTNGYRSFVILPDGSKEGWAESDAGDTARAAFVSWLRDHCMVIDDGRESWYVDWVEIEFPGDGPAPKILRGRRFDA